ncbi:hypothetical protein GQ607_012909 [Colletotrichum asianum]|uniref:Uncharacterized protein n=1 Tax=Colletotrichum asianum TaxID=702518 RepID=A0A8H3ZL98_9PEZI|nr:hypothetical protein GQ607_012909 [Colletotrichum asianum]
MGWWVKGEGSPRRSCVGAACQGRATCGRESPGDVKISRAEFGEEQGLLYPLEPGAGVQKGITPGSSTPRGPGPPARRTSRIVGLLIPRGWREQFIVHV